AQLRAARAGDHEPAEPRRSGLGVRAAGRLTMRCGGRTRGTAPAAPIAACCAALCFAGAAAAQDYQILYYERVPDFTLAPAAIDDAGEPGALQEPGDERSASRDFFPNAPPARYDDSVEPNVSQDDDKSSSPLGRGDKPNALPG